MKKMGSHTVMFLIKANILTIDYIHVRFTDTQIVNSIQNICLSFSVLSYKTFKNFIDQFGDYLLLIILWDWGEPFLNPDIFKIISYAKTKNILIHSSTNGNVRFSEEKAEELVNSGLDSLIVAVDGATQETYGKYRNWNFPDL